MVPPRQSTHPPPQPSTSSAMSPPTATLGMSPAARYNHNLRVLRKRDPSITSIFDQFSHVAVYHHDGKSWKKNGYEGSMFLFERTKYPPYGFYVLNRVGMEDYIQPLYPEDDLIETDKYLIIRTFPDFLAARLAAIPAAPPGEVRHTFDSIYDIPNLHELDKTQKGRMVNIALWVMNDAKRDSMMRIMKRVHDYIKQNQPYPEEFRYGPDRPPPNTLRAAPTKNTGSSGDASDSQPNQSDSENDNRSDAPSSGGELSEVEKLFAGITPSPGPSSSSRPTPQRSNAAIDSLFANVGTPSPPTNIPPSPSPAPSSGPQLLNAMFAFARSAAPQQPPAIHSPQPSTSPPQVLTQDVLSNLLGLPPSRTASAASGYSTSAVSHPSSREGDNEDDSSSDSPSTIFHPDDPGFGPQVRNGNLARMTGTELLKDLGLNVPHRLGGPSKINGDVTPRGPLNGLHSKFQLPPAIETTSSIATVRGNSAPSAPASSASVKPRANRELQRFESDSELWPYTRGPIEDNSPTDVCGEDNEIVELNFEETSVLSDPVAFDQALRNRKSAVNLRVHNGVGSSPLPNGNCSPSGAGKKGGRKSKRERDAKAREEIERSWDIPPPSPASTSGTCFRGSDILFGPPASPSPCPSPELALHGPPAPEMKTPTMTARATLSNFNGNGISPHNNSNSKGKGKMAVNGHSTKLNGHVNGVDANIVNESLITTIETQPHPVPSMTRNDFVKEVLTLIHTDKTFVDTLWQNYMARMD